LWDGLLEGDVPRWSEGDAGLRVGFVALGQRGIGLGNPQGYQAIFAARFDLIFLNRRWQRERALKHSNMPLAGNPQAALMLLLAASLGANEQRLALHIHLYILWPDA
jgi:hypothetical protein